MSDKHAKHGDNREALLAVLHCPDCADDVPHRVTYRLGTVVETVCTRCERALVSPRRHQAALGEQRGVTSAASSTRRAAPTIVPMLSVSSERLGSLAVGLPVRALTKPRRLWQEMRRGGPGVLLSVPRRAVTKPVRLMAELAGLGRYVR